MATIKEVAEEAGVSKSTVSRYISQNGYVSDEAREKIKKAIEKLHYSPNLIAQSLKTKKINLSVCSCLIYQTHSFHAWPEGLKYF